MNITVAADTTLYNECMKESGTEEKTGFVVRRFTGVTTGEACSGTSATQAEAWLVKSADSFGPGIKITYPPDNEVAVQVTELVIGSFSFTK